MSLFAKKFGPIYERWRSDIRVYAREAKRFDCTWQQQQLLDLVQLESMLPPDKRKKRIAVRSGQGPGKSTAAYIVAEWRTIRYPNSICVVTAPNMRQCKQFIDEGARLLKQSHPLLQRFVKPYGTKIEINGSNLWSIRTATATRPENLQGIHEKHLTFIADEASGVSRPILETIKGTLSNPDSLFLEIGNPNTTDCGFHDCFTIAADQWHRLAWNAEDTARDYPWLVDPKRNEDIAKEYGRDSDTYRIRVLGEFPIQDPNSLMSLADLMTCTKGGLFDYAAVTDVIGHNNAIGIDYARFGSDESVVVRRQGLAVVEWKVFLHFDPREVTDYAFRMQYDAGLDDANCWYLPDADNMGQGIAHSFHEAGKRVLEFRTQSRAWNARMFADRMSEAWWSFRNLVRQHAARIPNDGRLLKQLSTRQYYMDRKGRIKVESKDEWRDRLETDESPDRADALIMAFYPHVVTTANVARARRRKHIVGTKARRKR